ncbi:DEAD/DEAH box helicase [bacterium]|nr:DEAD/DEAH box helicase [bacterium]
MSLQPEPPLHSFPYDPFQAQAIDAVNRGVSVVVAAPTGAGKTVIADHVIAEAIARNERVIYTAPIKALSNQKYRDFSGAYGDLIGIVTGDVAINPRAPVRIMTTEIYRNTLLDEPDQIADTSWVILDEVHYLDDRERGTVWEESIILTPPATRILSLSATVPNVEEIAAWMREVLNRPTEVVVETKRPVPLHFSFQCQNNVYDDWKSLRQHGYTGMPARHRRRFGRHEHGVIPNRIHTLVRELANDERLPCIYFAFGRRQTEELAQEMVGFQFLDETEQAEARARYHALCTRFDLIEEPSAQRMRMFIQRGIAFHHAGMLPTLKEAIEQLFTAKLIKLIFTTETFALGINMPARTVVFDSLRKYYAHGFANLRTRDFYQMAGRAGRRGMDAEGFVYLRLVPTRISLAEVNHIITGPQEPVESQFNASYATVLNLYELHQERVIDFYPRTLHCFQASKSSRRRARQKFIDRLDLLKETGCIRHAKLTVKGKFASWMYGYELYLGELFEAGLLDRFAESEMCFALSCLVFEPRPGTHFERTIPKNFQWVARELERVHRRIHQLESKYDIEPFAPPPHTQLGWAIDAWSKGADFATTVEKAGLDEGELVRYLRMIIQLLRQLAQAPYTSDKLRQTAKAARARIDRDVVDAERQLRA